MYEFLYKVKDAREGGQKFYKPFIKYFNIVRHIPIFLASSYHSMELISGQG